MKISNIRFEDIARPDISIRGDGIGVPNTSVLVMSCNVNNIEYFSHSGFYIRSKESRREEKKILINRLQRLIRNGYFS